MNRLQHKQPFLLLGTTVEGNKDVILTGTDFERHKWVQGISGSGKSTFLAWIAVSLLRQGIGFSLIDPHGDLCRLILSLLASSDFFSNPRAFERVWLVDFNRTDATIPFNVLQQPYYDSHTIASNLLDAMHRAFPTTGTTANLDNVLLAATYVLAENGKSILDLQRLLLDAPYREKLLQRVTDPLVSQFFAMKFADKVNSQLIDSTLRRSFLLTFSSSLRNALGQTKNMLQFRNLMDTNITCLFSLGGLDDQSKRLLGSLLMVGLEQAFLSRATLPPDRRVAHHVIVDEFPLFIASGDSFSVILEQVRKYKGTLYLANQTYSQLSKELIGSLQNALPVLMKAGTDDSSALAARFFRVPQEDTNTGFFDFLGLRKPAASAFANVKNTQEARLMFETLKRQEALVTIEHEVKRIVTPTLPIHSDPRILQTIEDRYASRLLVPIGQQKEEITQPVRVAALSDGEYTSRRVRVPSRDDTEPITLSTGVLDTDVLLSLFHFHYMTLQQLAKLLQKETSSNYIREKLNKYVADGVIDKVTLPRTSTGKPPTVYFLTTKGYTKIADMFGLPVPLTTGARKHQFLEHTLSVNDVLLAAAHLPRVAPGLTLHRMHHERTLKASPTLVASGRSVIPDGFVEFRTSTNEAIGLCLEIDRNTEGKEKILEKLQNYLLFARGPYQQAFGLASLTIAFIVTDGSSRRLSSLLQWSKDSVAHSPTISDQFLFAAVSLPDLSPASLFLDPMFVGVDASAHALIEAPF